MERARAGAAEAAAALAKGKGERQREFGWHGKATSVLGRQTENWVSARSSHRQRRQQRRGFRYLRALSAPDDEMPALE